MEPFSWRHLSFYSSLPLSGYFPLFSCLHCIPAQSPRHSPRGSGAWGGRCGTGAHLSGVCAASSRGRPASAARPPRPEPGGPRGYRGAEGASSPALQGAKAAAATLRPPAPTPALPPPSLRARTSSNT